MLLDGAAQFTVIATGVCLAIGCHCFHMRLPAKTCSLACTKPKKYGECG